MKLTRTDSFKRDFQALSPPLQKQVEKALCLLVVSFRHPSLRVHKMEPRKRNILEARVTEGYRLTFIIAENEIILRRVGTHDILRTP